LKRAADMALTKSFKELGQRRVASAAAFGEATKLEALRAAAHVGIGALDRGEFKEFADALALIAHFNKVGDAAISGAGREAYITLGRQCSDVGFH